jgi:hypothetical protein
LYDAVKTIDAIKGTAAHWNADDGEGGQGGDHARQMSGTASAGDDDSQTTPSRLLSVRHHEEGCSVRRYDLQLEGHGESFQHLARLAHDAQVGVGTHDYRDERRRVGGGQLGRLL